MHRVIEGVDNIVGGTRMVRMCAENVLSNSACLHTDSVGRFSAPRTADMADCTKQSDRIKGLDLFLVWKLGGQSAHCLGIGERSL